jgi:hypothetical protein
MPNWPAPSSGWERVRLELALIMNRTAPAGLPSGFGPAGLSDTDRSLIVVLAQDLGPRGLQACSELLHSYQSTPEASEFDRLPADAGEQTRDELARRLHPHVQDLLVEHPGILDLNADAPGARSSPSAPSAWPCWTSTTPPRST